jgi:hypothetical protein
MVRNLGYIINGRYIKSDTIDNDVKKGKEHSGYRDHRRKEMARDYARDLVQPWTPEFIEANPTKARALGMVPKGEE